MSALWLSDNPIGDKGLQTIFDALKQNNTLKYLSVAKCGMTKTGVTSLADVMSTNKTLETVRIGYNKLGDRGITLLSGVLKQNNALKCLTVAGCGMTDTGVASLADALHTNNTLETLRIDGNDTLTENGLTCFVEVLSRNSGLVTLWLPRHLRSSMDKVQKSINEARKRSGLTAIEVDGKYFEKLHCFHDKLNGWVLSQ